MRSPHPPHIAAVHRQTQVARIDERIGELEALQRLGLVLSREERTTLKRLRRERTDLLAG
jgi:hypothetical protein